MCVCVGARERAKAGRQKKDRPLCPLDPQPPSPHLPLPSINCLPRYGSLTCGALAKEIVDLVDTLAVVQTGAVGALVCIDVTERPFVAWSISKGAPAARCMRSIFTLVLKLKLLHQHIIIFIYNVIRVIPGMQIQ